MQLKTLINQEKQENSETKEHFLNRIYVNTCLWPEKAKVFIYESEKDKLNPLKKPIKVSQYGTVEQFLRTLPTASAEIEDSEMGDI